MASAAFTPLPRGANGSSGDSDGQTFPSSRGRIFIMLGPPASGKGTQCKKLADKIGLVHLSTGDAFRDVAERGTELGLRAKEFIDKGCYVPDDMAVSLVRDRLGQRDVLERGCLLDGFPRTVEQAKALLKHVKVDGVFLLQAPDDILIARAADRRIDPETGDIYHLQYIAPPPEIASRLIPRARDDEQSFKQRIEVFKRTIREVLPYFSGQVHNIDATLEPNEVLQRIQPIVCSDCIAASSAKPASSGDALCGKSGEGEVSGKPDEQTQNSMDVDDDDWSDDGEPEHQEDLSLVVAPCSDVSDEGGEVKVMIRALVPEATARVSADICCVIDVSGSMSSAATYETADGKVQNDGLSVLDIVKHATKTVLKALTEGDRLALVAFNHQAETVLQLTAMNSDGQELALTALDALRPGGQTNIWAGILAAMDALRAGSAETAMANRRRAILLLTDGQPNIVPPKGHLPELRDYMDTHPNFTCQLNTFGFGYNLDSELLLDLARDGNGTYAFIPDAVIVGTTFVNSVANVLSTCSQSATLNLMPRGGAKLDGAVLGGFSELNESWGKAVSLGPLLYGQPRDIVVPLCLPPSSVDCRPYLEIVLTYATVNGRVGRASVDATSRKSSAEAVVALCRSSTVSTGYDAIARASKGEVEQAGKDVESLCARLNSASDALALFGSDSGMDGHLSALKADTDGRMSKALQGKDRFNRWGKHYLRALMRSHQLQCCTNFMDTGLQVYGGTLFRSLRDTGDKIFLSLPPPKPQRAAARTSTCSSTTSATTTTTASSGPNMTTYYAGAGGG